MSITKLQKQLCSCNLITWMEFRSITSKPTSGGSLADAHSVVKLNKPHKGEFIILKEDLPLLKPQKSKPNSKTRRFAFLASGVVSR